MKLCRSWFAIAWTRCLVALALCCWWSGPSAAAELLPAETPIEQAIDHYIDLELKSASCEAAPPAEPTEQIRRLTLDLTGRIPTVAEVRQYLESTSQHKQAELVERLIASPAFSRYQVYCFDHLLMAGTRGSVRGYLQHAFAQGYGWDRIFRDLLLPPERPEPAEANSAEFVKTRLADLDQLTNDVSVLFFGVNISCARCHDHPLVDAWKQDHFFGMKSFFNRSFDANGFVAERNYGLVNFRTVAGEDKTAQFMFLSGRVVDVPPAADPNDQQKKAEKQLLEELKKSKAPPPRPDFSVREQLVQVALEKSEQEFLARSLVNRLWYRLFDYGLVMPFDQMHAENAPSHPELLSWLARDLAEHDYDLRRLLRGMVLSQAYLRSSYWEGNTRPAQSLFAVANLRALSPHQYATSLQLSLWDQTTLDLSDPARLDAQLISCENAGRALAGQLEMPGEDFQIGVGESLLLSNSSQVARDHSGDGKGRLLAALAELENPEEIAERLAWNVWGRAPSAEQQQTLAKYLKERTDRRLAACQQLWWALVTSSEFRFNH